MGLFINLEEDIKTLQKKIIFEDSIDTNDIITESYELYNKAIDMISNNCFTSARKTLQSANIINGDDEDITIALGLLNLLFCNFNESCKYLYKSYTNSSNNLAKKYIDIIINDEFKSFLENYNLGLIKANEGKYSEAIEIFLNIVDKEASLIEGYVILYSIYEKIGNNTEKDECINLIKILDKDNEILDSLYKEINIGKNIDKTNKLNITYKSKNIKLGIFFSIILLVFSSIVFKYKSNKVTVNNIDESVKYEQYNNENYEKEETHEKDMDEDNNEDIDEIESIDLPKISEEELLNEANNFKRIKNYKEAIKVYKNIIMLNENPDMVSEAIYQVAILSETIKDNDEAIKYYNEYIDKYSTSYPYYDESYYNIAMIYHENGDIEKCKRYLSELIVKDPKSIYNNTKVNQIIEN